MKRIILMFIALFLTINGFSQLSNQTKPRSFSLDNIDYSKIETFSVEEPNFEEINAQDLEAEKEFKLRRFGVIVPMNIDFYKNATKITTTEGNLYLMKIKAKESKALTLYSSNFFIPEGGELHLYSPNKTRYIGGFTTENNNDLKTFATELIHGNEMIIEYFEPNFNTQAPRIEITEIGYAYRDVNNWEEEFQETINENIEKSYEYGSSGSCNVNANCPEGNNFRNQQRGILRIMVKISSWGMGWCSGSLVNNTSRDLKPYVLTAAHCVEDLSNDYYYSQFVFYFNYESPSCNNPLSESSITTTRSLTGASKIAIDPTYSSNGSDFLLLLLTNNVPQNYNAYWNGWNINNTSSSSGVSIHHPSGDIKKISTYNTPLVSVSYDSESPNINGTHWKVKWASTTTNYGITEGGSSGSSIFNQNGEIIGTLTGGYSSCTAPNEYKIDYYGKMSYHWQSNGLISSNRLSNWLNPNNYNLTNFHGDDYTTYLSINNINNGNDIRTQTYPNPAKDILNLSLENNNEDICLEIYNRLGVKLLRETIKANQNQKSINIEKLESGVYFLRYISPSSSWSDKIIIEK